MVKSIIFIVSFIFSFSCLCQTDKIWWLKTPENEKYEKNYETFFSSFNDGALKDEVMKYIKCYIDSGNKKNEEVAIIVELISVSNDTTKYSISYSSNYYSNITTSAINYKSVTKINNKIVFFKRRFNNDFAINEHFLYGLLRARFPKITKELNTEYKEELKDNVVPVIFVLEHQIPYWYIVLKDGKLINKEIEVD